MRCVSLGMCNGVRGGRCGGSMVPFCRSEDQAPSYPNMQSAKPSTISEKEVVFNVAGCAFILSNKMKNCPLNHPEEVRNTIDQALLLIRTENSHPCRGLCTLGVKSLPKYMMTNCGGQHCPKTMTKFPKTEKKVQKKINCKN